jgi:uncharacterized protein with HEPN domain
LSSRPPEQSLSDILTGISTIEDFTEGVSIAQFRDEPMRVAAVERYLLVISEAAIRLGPQAETLCPGPPWNNIRGIGNWIGHQYDRVDLETVWHTTMFGLPPLKSSVTAALERMDLNSPFL